MRCNTAEEQSRRNSRNGCQVLTAPSLSFKEFQCLLFQPHLDCLNAACKPAANVGSGQSWLVVGSCWCPTTQPTSFGSHGQELFGQTLCFQNPPGQCWCLFNLVPDWGPKFCTKIPGNPEIAKRTERPSIENPTTAKRCGHGSRLEELEPLVVTVS